MRKWPPLLLSRENKIEITVGYYYSPTRLVKIKKAENIRNG
jgi:hypothetical protein